MTFFVQQKHVVISPAFASVAEARAWIRNYRRWSDDVWICRS
jgi:hypothetical protein